MTLQYVRDASGNIAPQHGGFTVPQITKTFTATGISDSVKSRVLPDRNVGISVSIEGLTAGSGTVQLQRFLGGDWKVVNSYTVDTEKLVESARSGVEHRLECSVFSSGTFVCVLG